MSRGAWGRRQRERRAAQTVEIADIDARLEDARRAIANQEKGVRDALSAYFASVQGEPDA